MQKFLMWYMLPLVCAMSNFNTSRHGSFICQLHVPRSNSLFFHEYTNSLITTSSAPLALNNLADHLEYFNIQFSRQRVQYRYRESVSTRAVLRVLNKKRILHVQAICHTEFYIIHYKTGQNVTCHAC